MSLLPSPRRQRTFAWRDVCPYCRDAFDMPADGLGSEHLCPPSPVPWRMLAERRIVPLRAAQRILAAVDGSPDEEGPFLPWRLPRPKRLADLVLWSSEQIREVYAFSRVAVNRLASWLEERGFPLARERRDLEALGWLLDALPPSRRPAIDYLERRTTPAAILRGLIYEWEEEGSPSDEADEEDDEDAQMQLWAEPAGQSRIIAFDRQILRAGERVTVEMRVERPMRIRKFVMSTSSILIEGVSPSAACSFLEDDMGSPIDIGLRLSDDFRLENIDNRYLRAGEVVRIKLHNPAKVDQEFSGAFWVVFRDEQSPAPTPDPYPFSALPPFGQPYDPLNLAGRALAGPALSPGGLLPAPSSAGSTWWNPPGAPAGSLGDLRCWCGSSALWRLCHGRT